jgi:hypothetical protein
MNRQIHLKRWLALPILLLVVLPGCKKEKEERVLTSYGRRSGDGVASINGTAVFSDMFQSAGHKTFSWSAFSPRLRERADCIVWFPDDFNPPSAKTVQWLEDWLDEKPGRTLIYVLRDYDAAPTYFEKALPKAPPEQKDEYRARADAAWKVFTSARRSIGKDLHCEWFSFEPESKPRMIHKLTGERAWVEGIDAAAAELQIVGRMIPSDDADVVLASDKEDDVLVARLPVNESQILLVANGSFLLNLPLVNRENRKLAGRLIDEIGPPGQDVMFVETRLGPPPIRDEDPPRSRPGNWRNLLTYPVDWIVMHLAVAGFVFLLWRWPIFGLPRELEEDSVADFGKHVTAVGAWLEKSRDEAFAEERLQHYQNVKDS